MNIISPPGRDGVWLCFLCEFFICVICAISSRAAWCVRIHDISTLREMVLLLFLRKYIYEERGAVKVLVFQTRLERRNTTGNRAQRARGRKISALQTPSPKSKTKSQVAARPRPGAAIRLAARSQQRHLTIRFHPCFHTASSLDTSTSFCESRSPPPLTRSLSASLQPQTPPPRFLRPSAVP